MVFLTVENDTYTITLARGNGKIISETKEIYIDELLFSLDELIETGDITKEEYADKVLAKGSLFKQIIQL